LCLSHACTSLANLLPFDTAPFLNVGARFHDGRRWHPLRTSHEAPHDHQHLLDLMFQDVELLGDKPGADEGHALRLLQHGEEHLACPHQNLLGLLRHIGEIERPLLGQLEGLTKPG
jgi:hypothetical protein